MTSYHSNAVLELTGAVLFRHLLLNGL